MNDDEEEEGLRLCDCRRVFRIQNTIFYLLFAVCKKQVHTHVDTHTCSTCVRTCAHDIHHIFVLKTEDEEVRSTTLSIIYLCSGRTRVNCNC